MKQFSTKIRAQVKRTSKTNIINALIKDYYEETLEQAQTNPKSFGDNTSIAEEDPKILAKQYTKDFRQALNLRDREALELLYANLLKEHEESGNPLI